MPPSLPEIGSSITNYIIDKHTHTGRLLMLLINITLHCDSLNTHIHYVFEYCIDSLLLSYYKNICTFSLIKCKPFNKQLNTHYVCALRYNLHYMFILI